MPSQDAVLLLQAAIEASIFVAPTEHGLTVAELYEVGKRAGLKEGETSDAVRELTKNHFGGRDKRVVIDEHLAHLCGYLTFAHDPELRDPEAFDFVVAELKSLEKEVGERNAQLARNVLVARADQALRHHVEVAITLMVVSGQLTEHEGMLRFKAPHFLPNRPLPSENRRPGGPVYPKTQRTRVMPIVEDIIARRTDGRPRSAEPLSAFSEQLDRLGYGRFQMWWHQTVIELGRTDPNSSPLSALVLAAALVEGVLTFVVKHAQNSGLGVFGSTDFTRDPKTWKIDDLVASAARGGDTAILDGQTKNRADGLIRTRQRIHAGRMLSEFPTGVAVPDLRPEEAREAKAVAEQVVRSVLDWLAKYPPT